MSSYYPEGVSATDPHFGSAEVSGHANCPKCDAEITVVGECGTDYTEPCSCGTNLLLVINDEGNIKALNADE